jgi:chromosome segregation ATPase
MCCAILAGCEGREAEKARQEAREAKVTVVKLEKNLADAIQEVSALKAELGAVQQARDELQERVDELLAERDKASALVQRAEEVITQLTARANGEASATAALRQQIAELQALVKEQEKTIEELQAAAAQGRITEATPDDLGLGDDVPDVNEPIEEIPQP